MNQKIFFIHFSHFITGQAAILVIGFVTFPILTRVLTIEQYGILSLVTNSMAIFVALAKAGLSDGIIRLYGKYSENRRKIIFASTIILGGGLLSLLATIGYLIILPHIYLWLGIEKQYQVCFSLMSLYLFIRPINIICLNLLRVRHKTLFFNILNLVNRIIAVSIGLVLLINIMKDLSGYFIGTIISEYIIFVVLAYWFLTNYKVKMQYASMPLSWQLISFGLPLLLTEIAYLLLSYADRYIILFYHGEKMLGLYSVGYNLAMYLSGLITFSISYSIVPLYVSVFEKEGKEATEQFLQDSLYYLLIGVAPVCFGYYAIVDDLFELLASKKYIDAATFSPLILYGSFFLGINSVLNAGLYVQKKSTIILLIICSGIVANIILNVLLIPKYFVLGAAFATFISCLITTIFTVILSFKLLYIKIRGGLIYHIVLSVVMYCCVSLIKIDTLILSLILKVTLGFIIVISGVLFKERELFIIIRQKLKC